MSVEPQVIKQENEQVLMIVETEISQMPFKKRKGEEEESVETLRKILELDKLCPSEIINYAQKYRLIPEHYPCPKCNTKMEIRSLESAADHLCWRCMCNTCRAKCSVRNGTWFEKSHLRISTILQIMFFWSDRQEHRIVRRELEISEVTVVEWYNLCREICVEVMLTTNDGKIGGNGKTVEIDVSKFGKRKFIKGQDVNGKWAFSGFERGSNRCILQVAEDTSIETFTDLLEKFIEPGTTILSQSWNPYKALGKVCCGHLTTTHSFRFLDSDVGTHSKTEGLWSCVKRLLPYYSRSKGFSNYLAEFMYRRKKSNEPCFYSAFTQDVATFYQGKT